MEIPRALAVGLLHMSIQALILHCTAVSQGNIQLTSEDSARAQKYSKYAGRALHYEHVTDAVQNLEKALKLLTIGRECSLCTKDPCLKN